MLLNVLKKDIFKKNFELSISFFIIVMKYIQYYIFVKIEAFT